MGKIVFWLIVVFAVLLVLRLVNTAKGRPRRETSGSGRQSGKQGAMVRCVDCGVYLPSADARTSPRGPLCGDPQCVRNHTPRND